MLTLETSAFKPFTVVNLRHQLNYPVMIIYCFIPANAVSLNSTPRFFLCGLWLQVGFQWKTEHLQWHQDQRSLSPTESKTIFLILLKPECQIYNNYSCYYDDLLTDGIFFNLKCWTLPQTGKSNHTYYEQPQRPYHWYKCTVEATTRCNEQLTNFKFHNILSVVSCVKAP